MFAIAAEDRSVGMLKYYFGVGDQTGRLIVYLLTVMSFK